MLAQPSAQEYLSNTLQILQSVPTRGQIIKLQEAMATLQCAQPEPRHFFAPGMYLRELLVPAGMLIVGKSHKTIHFFMVLKGRAEVISEFDRKVVEAGHISVSLPGIKRVALALEDTQFVTVHVNASDTHDLEIIEAEHIEAELLNLAQSQQPETIK